jgi:glycosyltransferase involved in cell wall biosynthesis
MGTGALRILQLAKWLSPREDTGGKIRACRIGGALASFAEVDAAGFVPPGERLEGTEEHLSHYGRLYPLTAGPAREKAGEILSGFAAGLSLRTARFFPGRFRSFLEMILREERYDVLQVEELPLMSALAPLPHALPVVYSAYNVESELSPLLFRRRNPLLRLLAEMEQRRTRREEIRALKRAGACLAVSDKDGDALRRLSSPGAPPVFVLPNCAQDRFRPSPRRAGREEILSVGSFGWHPNADGMSWFLDHVLPLLRREAPGAVVRIAGSGIGRLLRRRMERRGVQVHPDVPDILPFLQNARLLFVPLLVGGGTRIKILEAWAAGLPVVATSVGADGLSCRPGEDILIADDPAGFAGAVSRLVKDDGLYEKLRSEGLKRARDHRWSGLAAPLREAYRVALREKGARRP